MKLFRFIKDFHSGEDGAVTVDWVVLTAAVVGLAISAFASVRGGTGALTSILNSYLSGTTINTVAL